MNNFFFFLSKFIIPMFFSRTFYSIMFLHSFLIIISFRLNLETDSLSHKLKARVPCRGWGIFILSMFSFSLLVSAFSVGIYRQKSANKRYNYLCNYENMFIPLLFFFALVVIAFYKKVPPVNNILYRVSFIFNSIYPMFRYPINNT